MSCQVLTMSSLTIDLSFEEIEQLALRALLASGVRADNAAYVATSDGGSSQLTALEINESGQITNWPDNFFGDQMSDLVAISQAAAGV